MVGRLEGIVYVSMVYVLVLDFLLTSVVHLDPACTVRDHEYELAT